MILLIALLFSGAAHADLQNICGDTDLRTPSKILPVGRMKGTFDGRGGKHCTATLISNTCAITAGHCMENIESVEFNVPESTDAGLRKNAAPEDVYPTGNTYGSVYTEGVLGQDWAVFDLGKNKITRKLPGKSQSFYPPRFTEINSLAGQIVRSTGYGSAKEKLNFAQQTAVGTLFVDPKTSVITFDIYATPGNSGSAIISESTQEAIGVLNQAGCRPDHPLTIGTSIWNNPEFQSAIQDCLQVEKDAGNAHI